MLPNDLIKRYEIASVGFTLETPEYFSDSPPYSLFLSQDGSVAAKYQFSYVPALPDEHGEILYQSDYVTVTEREGQRYRFVSTGSEKPPYSCTCLSTSGEKIPVYLTEHAPKMWGGLMLESLGLEHLLAKYDRMILHASYIAADGGAILFTGPCQIGKSTQAELWRRYRGADVINGDRACLSADAGSVMAHGLPVSGTSRICYNRSMPVRAIVALEQANNNQLEFLTGGAALRVLYSGTWVNTWDSSDVESILTLIQNIVTHIPVVRLRCLPDRTAVDLLAEAIMR